MTNEALNNAPSSLSLNRRSELPTRRAVLRIGNTRATKSTARFHFFKRFARLNPRMRRIYVPGNKGPNMRAQGGVVGDSSQAANPSGGAGARHGLTQPALQVDLMEAVVAPENMRRAWARVKSNKGAPGMDGMPIEDFPAFARVHWPAIRQALLDSHYRPSPVRRVVIPKPDGGERALGIPNVVDRLIQQAIAQVLTPIFDPDFSASSFGFRPKRSAHGALKQVKAYVLAGYCQRSPHWSHFVIANREPIGDRDNGARW